MASFASKKVVRTYSRQSKRPLYEEPPTKRRRVETAIESVEAEAPTTSPVLSTAHQSSPSREDSSPPTSSPKESPAIFSDQPARSSPPSSPTPRSSPPPVQKRRPVFSIFKKQAKRSPSSNESHTDKSQNAQSPPQLPQKKKPMVQMQLDLASETRKTCKTCGMQYIPSNLEDAALHKKFHAMNLGGMDLTKPLIQRFRKNEIWSGGEGSFIAVVGRKDAPLLRSRASDLLNIVNTELAAVPITDEELWSQKNHSVNSDAKPVLVDRFKVYLYIRGNKCVGACLAERIWEAFQSLDPGDTSGEARELPVVPQSSSLSISTEPESAILGISRIWTSNQYRKQGIATRLLDCARANFLYGMKIEKAKVAFSQPTESGGNLARKWYGSQAGWHVYID